jgi:hypothetical protein
MAAVHNWDLGSGDVVEVSEYVGWPTWTIELCLSVIILTWYGVGCLMYKTEKQRAYIISVLNAALSFVAGVYICHYQADWNLSITEKVMRETTLSRFMVRFFRVVQVLDILVGLVHYRSQLTLLTTWIHHGCYTLLCNWMLKRHISVLFGICFLEELPTLIMAVGRLERRLRSDGGFGITYFALRVGMHTLLTYNVVMYNGGDDRIGVIRFNFLLTWCLHVNWFISWIKQQVRLRRELGKSTKMSSD